MNLHIVNISYTVFSGLLYWIEKSQEFYMYYLAYAGIVLLLFPSIVASSSAEFPEGNLIVFFFLTWTFVCLVF